MKKKKIDERVFCPDWQISRMKWKGMVCI